jgi:hypothetical protein
MFGYGQRDLYTVPSVVTRLAEQDNLRILARNFGVIGDVNWQGIERFQQYLTDDDRATPELVVFYDGPNDMSLGRERQLTSVHEDEVARLQTNPQDRRPRIDPQIPEAAATVDEDRLVRQVAGQLRMGVEASQAIARATSVEVRHYWQPSIFTKQYSEADAPLYAELGLTVSGVDRQRALVQRVLHDAPDDLVDLSGALDHIEEPVFLDSTHTNELGAREIALRIYSDLRPRLQALTSDAEVRR